jgi:hypothetical protein
VLHALAGPADAATLLREARWAVETWKLALLECAGDPARRVTFFRRAHAERLRREHGLDVPAEPLPANALRARGLGGLLEEPAVRGLSRQGQVHLLLARGPRHRLRDLYRVVFENVLGERVSTGPVEGAGGRPAE